MTTKKTRGPADAANHDTANNAADNIHDTALAALDAEIARVRLRDEQKLIKCAQRAGLFNVRISASALQQMMNIAIDTMQPPRSKLAALIDKRKLHEQRARQAKRSDEARIKAILGGFFVAQCRYQPKLFERYRPLIEAHIARHPVETTAAENATFMKPFLNALEESITDAQKEAQKDGHTNDQKPSAGDTTGDTWAKTPTLDRQRIHKQSARDRARRLIILGAWLIDEHTKNTELNQLIHDQINGFLEADKIPNPVQNMLKQALKI